MSTTKEVEAPEVEKLAEDLAKLSTSSKRSENIKIVAEKIKSGAIKNIIVLSGAGLSTAAGIPDFRSPNTGLYSTIAKKYPNLSDPSEIFSIDLFAENPFIYYEFERNGFLVNLSQYKPTISHYLIRLLQDKGLLLRNYTQNIDGLETQAGVLRESLIQVHGSYDTASCINCSESADLKKLAEYLKAQQGKETLDEKSLPRCEQCGGLVKPDVVFFGESLPARFRKHREDVKACDMILVMGTSLQVRPVALLPSMVLPGTARVLINRDLCGDFFENKNYSSDVFLEGDLEASSKELIEALGWSNDLQELLKPKENNEAQSTTSGNQVDDKIQELLENITLT